MKLQTTDMNQKDTGRFIIERSELQGLCVLKHKPYADHRGEFTRIYCYDEFSSIGLNKPIAQINRSKTRKAGTIRGMHFQLGRHAEDKVISCTAGKVFDVAVDLRRHSKTFLRWFGMELSSENHTSLLVPAGFAHGFQTLEDNSEIVYFVTNKYSVEAEVGLHPLDPTLSIQWPLPLLDISEKDASRPHINKATYVGV